MLDVKRFSRATYPTNDIEKITEYYQAIIGLQLVDKTPQRAVMATKMGEEAIIFDASPDAHGDRVLELAFQVPETVDLDEQVALFNREGIGAEIVTDVTPAVRKALEITDPGGSRIQIMQNPQYGSIDTSNIGVGPLKLGHLGRKTTDVMPYVDFYTKLFGFKLSDWREGLAYFLRCDRHHHSINFFKHKTDSLHHMAFELSSWGHLHDALDLLGRNSRKCEWGPSRHTIAHNVAAYHRDPEGRLVEFFTEMDIVNELGFFEPRPWHDMFPQRPQAWPDGTSSNYWGELEISAADG